VDPRGQPAAQAVAEFELLRPDMLLG